MGNEVSQAQAQHHFQNEPHILRKVRRTRHVHPHQRPTPQQPHYQPNGFGGLHPLADLRPQQPPQQPQYYQPQPQLAPPQPQPQPQYYQPQRAPPQPQPQPQYYQPQQVPPQPQPQLYQPISFGGVDPRALSTSTQQQQHQITQAPILATAQQQADHEFQKSIEELSKANPYEVIGCPDPNMPLKEIERIYRKRAHSLHPDRGGSKILFNILQNAMERIRNEKDAASGGTMHRDMTARVTKQSYNPSIEGVTGMSSIHLNPKDFDPNKFNAIFEKFRMEDPNDQGYGDRMVKGGTREEISIARNARNTGDINSHFDRMATQTQQAIQVYTEPKAILSTEIFKRKGGGGNIQFTELGVNKIDDFTGEEYTDYMRAHSGTTMNPGQGALQGRPQTLQQLKQEMAKPLVLTPEQQEAVRRAEEEERQREAERQRNMAYQSQRINEHFRSINHQLIVDAPPVDGGAARNAITNGAAIPALTNRPHF